ncbi:MAG: helix-turn-helix domain-containing protein [Lachnospiraceae bacterium]
MIIISKANLAKNKEEILPINPEDFPHVCLHAEMDHFINKTIAWHWHPFFEIDYIEEGEIEFSTTNETVTLQKGEAIFINASIPHSVHAKNNMQNCRLYAHFFDMHFLSGIHNSFFERKYMAPITKCKDFTTYTIQRDSSKKRQMLNLILNSTKVCETENFGYEFEIRANLSHFWYLMLEENADFFATHTSSNNTDSVRIKVMLKLIHEFYNEKLTLSDIARAANISTRECMRCFSECIGISPINYLNAYRIRMAAGMLLQTNFSVITISEKCGFSSNSYFSKVFRETFNCTPKKYRQQNHNIINSIHTVHSL